MTSGAGYDEIIASGIDFGSGSTMVDVFTIPMNAETSSLIVDAFATNPDGTLIGPDDSPAGSADTTLGVRVKSTGEWVTTDDDNNSQIGTTVYDGGWNESRLS